MRSPATRQRCAYCAKRLPPPLPGVKPRGQVRKYCGYLCRQRANRARWWARRGDRKPGDPLPRKKCVGCGATFTPASGSQRYCTRRCQQRNYERDKRQAPPPSLNCLHCGAEFTPNGCRQLYCAPLCQGRAARAGGRDRSRRILVKRVLDDVSCAAIKRAAKPLGLTEPQTGILAMVRRLRVRTLRRLLRKAHQEAEMELDVGGGEGRACWKSECRPTG